MEWVESYEYCIQQKQMNALTLLLSMMVDWIDKKMNDSNEVWLWVHKNMEQVKLYENFIQLKQKNAITLMFLMMFDWIRKIIKHMNCN